MISAPQSLQEYSDRQSQAARRVLMDIGQVLAAYRDCFVVVGGWTPDLLLPPDPAEEEMHIGSIDVDLVLDVEKLKEGQYATFIELLLNTGRYRKGEKPFQLMVEVDLEDGEPPVQVDVDFLASTDIKLKKNKPKLLKDFRVLQQACFAVALHAPEEIPLEGPNVTGMENTVRLRVVALPDFVIMKADAINLRDKPKDVYDLCYVLDRYPGGLAALAENWNARPDAQHAVAILRSKFAEVNFYGPQQLVKFHQPATQDEGERLARRAYALVQKFLGLLSRE